MTIRILIAEHDVGVAGLFASSLGRYGFTCTTATDGPSALAAFQKGGFDVVLLDADLPRGDGLEVAAAIRTSRNGNQTGLAVVRADPRLGHMKEQALRKAGVDASFEQPFRMTDIRNRLAELAHRYTGAVSDLVPLEGSRPVGQQAAAAPRPVATAPPAPMKPSAAASSARPISTPTTASPKPPAGASARPNVIIPPAPPAPPGSRDVAPGAQPGSQSGSGAPGGAARRAPTAPTAPDPFAPFFAGAPVPIAAGRVAEALLALSRNRKTGVLLMKAVGAEARVAFLRGVPVGATDNAPDNRLGGRLVRSGRIDEAQLQEAMAHAKEKGGRIGDALLTLEFVDPATLLDELRAQSQERLTLAAGWSVGEMRFGTDAKALDQLAVGSFDLLESLMTWFLRRPDEAAVESWYRAHAKKPIGNTADFEEGLVAFARLDPTSPLPGILYHGGMTLEQLVQAATGGNVAAARIVATQLHAMATSGLIVVGASGRVEGAPIPRPFKPEEIARDVVDDALANGVQREWLRTQGRDYYEILEVDREIGEPALMTALTAYGQRWGRATLATKRLGPVDGLVRDLVAIVDDMTATLSDPDRRTIYDEGIDGASALASDDPYAAEERVVEGKMALQAGDIDAALAAFRAAAELSPDDVEATSHLAFAELLAARKAVDEARARLAALRERHPAAMRPLLLLGRAALICGDPAAAREPLLEAARRAPGDPEVERALREVIVEGESA